MTHTTEELGQLHDLIQRMKKSDECTSIVNSEICKFYSGALSRIYKLSDLIELLSDMLSDDYFPNREIIHQMMRKMSDFKLFAHVIDFYDIAMSKRLATADTLNRAIDMISLSNPTYVAEVKRIYDQSLVSGLVDIGACIRMIDLFSKSIRPDFRLMYNIFLDSLSIGIKDTDLVNNILKFMAKSERPDPALVLIIFNDTNRLSFVNQYTFNFTLSCLAKAGHPAVPDAMSVFDESKKMGLANHVTYNAILNVFSKSPLPDYDKANSIFSEAIALGYDDKFTYNMMLNVISKTARPNIHRATQIFEYAKRRGLQDEYLYNTILNVIFKSEKPDIHLAELIFEEARSHHMADKITFSNFIDILAKCRNNVPHRWAYDLIHEARCKGVMPEYFDGAHGREIDLHDMSYGVAYFVLRRRLLTGDTGRLQVICGKGIHSRVTSGVHPLRMVVNELMEEMRAYGISGALDRFNSGRFNITIPSRPVPTLFGFASRTGDSETSSLMTAGLPTSFGRK